MSDQRDPRFDVTGRPARVPSGAPGPRPGHPHRAPAAGYPGPRPRPPRPGPFPPPGQPPVPPGGRIPPQRYRPKAPPGPYSSGDMPLLTHDGSDRAAPAGPGGVAVAEQTKVRTGSRAEERAAKAGKNGTARRSSPWRRVRRVLYALLGLMVLGPVVAFVIGWFVFSVPTAAEAALPQVARFDFSNGEPIAVLRPQVDIEGDKVRINRVIVALDQVPEHVREAVVATEDGTFYSNPGFDITGIGRAVLNQLTGGVGGGSTITQQWVKNATGQDDFSLWRKYREVILAVKVTREQTKDEILENYLNTIYFGRGAYGIQAAATAYFNKPVDQLTVSEGALLAGIIQQPNGADPANDLAEAEERWNVALDRMVAEKFLDPAERAQQTFPTNWLPEAPANAGIPDNDLFHVYQKALQELEQHGITQEQIDTAGLTVTTTIDPELQQKAVDAVTEVMEGQPENLRESLVSVDPQTGAMLAYYGGPSGPGMDYASALRQPGSSFKPFVVSAALQNDDEFGLGSVYDGSSPQELAGRTIKNSEGNDCPRCAVKRAMTKSINTVFYQIALDIGPQKVVEAAHQAGIPEERLGQPAQGGISLGDQEVTPVDMASAFGTFAAEGVHREPYLVSKVVAADGRVLFEREPPAEVAPSVPPQVARNVVESMTDVAAGADNALSGGRPVAAKTGTVQNIDVEGQNKDAWMVGFTPSISTAVWIGTDYSDPIKNSAGRPIYGSMLPADIWEQFMDAALRGTPEEQFSEFEPMGTAPSSEANSRSDAGASSTPSTGTPATGSAGSGDSGGDDGSGNGNDGSGDSRDGNSRDSGDSGAGDSSGDDSSDGSSDEESGQPFDGFIGPGNSDDNRGGGDTDNAGGRGEGRDVPAGSSG
ncbi:transglycosylase domain-containing protein [Pseudonocardia nigra]|uniref:transglycosylase domain-containing protein n=1 Tax=Pseudonocardia nigra TaxID=1921578 RepID=UPI001C5D5219|nr:transglycosylase domain-containing protein [Pseudonocardia nigra]